ncbi:MAG TPA: hypothetical protein PL024_04780 [Thauera sp.]|nr:hypothetical protein [Thauera sp.]
MTHLAPHRLAYCTIASANYLPRVQVFLRALSAHQPDAEAFVLLCETEEVCRRIADETSFPFLSPAAICPEHWMEMAFQYDVIEFNTAMKPFLLDALLDKGFDGVFYFDPDISIYSSLEPLEHALASHDVVLTPHACHPVPEDGCVPAMADYLRAGQFNLGFVGMAGSANGRTMLAWWKAVCRDRCIFDPTYRLFVDQFWAAAFASFAERLCVFRHPGANVAYWNLFQRGLECGDTGWRVDGEALLFFHFSGLASEDLTRVSRYQNRVSAPQGSPLHRILTGYAEDVAHQSWGRYRQEPYSFGFFADGSPVETESRRKYLSLSRMDKQGLGNPFEKQKEIRSIVRVVMKGTERSHLARVRYERYWRMLGLVWQEFREKLRTRGPWATFKLIARFVFRKITDLVR